MAENAVAEARAARVSTLVANNPDQDNSQREAAEEAIKAELLKDLSLEDVRQIITFIKSGGLKPAPSSHDAPDTFDEYGRNFRRMVHLMDVTGPSGSTRQIERPMANSLKEAREAKPPADYFDIDQKVWILWGFKRQRDYPENTVEYTGGPPA